MSVLPNEFMEYFETFDLADDSSPSLESFSVLTIDTDEWPRSAQLSVGEIYLPSNNRVRIALWPESTSSGNIKRNGMAVFTFAWSGAVATIRCSSISQGEFSTDLQLDVFEFEVLKFQVVRAPYARVESGLRFSLYEKSKVIDRWQRQRRFLETFFMSTSNESL